MKFLVQPNRKYEYGFCNNTGCQKNACNSYTNNSCPGNVKVDVSVKV